MKKFSLSLAALAILFIACEKKEETKDPVEKQPKEVVAPSTYKFERNGKSSVSYSGQTTRIAMANEFSSALLDTGKTEAQLKAMYDHKKDGADFSNTELNASSKQLKNKTAASADYFADNATVATKIKGEFDRFIGLQASVFPSWGDEAAADNAGSGYGKPGYVEELNGKKRYVGVLGVEYNQVIAKSLIGALMADQILNNYTSTAVLDAGTNKADNDADKLAEGKNYTTMEHKWDEAFGYLYGADNAEDPKYKADSFLNKYVGKVDTDEDFKGIAKTIYDAFKLGRAAIVAKNYEVRDAQAEIIRENISKVIAVRAVYYLQSGKKELTKATPDKGAAFHDLSEAIGFINSLQFTRKKGENKPYFTKAEVDGFVYADMLKYTPGQPSNGLWSLDTAKLDEISTKIATKFGFDVAKAGSLL